MRKKLSAKKRIAVMLAAALVLAGCGSGSAGKAEEEAGTLENAAGQQAEASVEENAGKAEDRKESGADVRTEGADDGLVEALKEKYAGAGAGEYSGSVIEVKRDESVQIALGYNPWASDLHIYDCFTVYQDADLKYPVDAGNYEYDADTGILTIEPPFYGIAEMHSSDDVDLSHMSGNYLSGDEQNGWGTFSQYYLAVSVDLESGEALDAPVITMIKVKAEIPQAPQLIFDQTKDGHARFSWQEVPGAKGYLLFKINKDETGFWESGRVFADVTGTEWTSEAEDNRMDGLVLSLNYRFEQYYTSEDMAAWIEETDSFLKDYQVEGEYDEFYSEYFGVIAYQDNGCSPVSNLLSAKDLAHMLPAEKASHSNEETFFGIESTADLPAVMSVTMCDGTTAQKVLDYDFESVKREEENNWYRITATAIQTPFEEEFTVFGPDWETLDDDLEAVRQRQEKLKNRGGNMVTLLEVSEGNEEEEAGSAGESEGTVSEDGSSEENGENLQVLETDITANSALSEYIAFQMLDTVEAIDISGFPEAADTKLVIDAFFEAQYQNPLILGVQGGSINTKERVLNVNYDFDRSETAQRQEKIRDKVGGIVQKIITDDMSDLEKEMAINSYLCENSRYDDAALENAEQYGFKRVDEEFYDSFTAYGILVDGVGVCASYSAAFKLLADAAGLDSIVVTGYLDGSVPHAWNKVRLDDSWYIVDATNNDNDVISNALLNLSDAAAYGTLVENDSFVMDSNLYDYAAGEDTLEYYHTIDRYFEREEISGELAELLLSEGKAVLRTDYDMDDEEFYSIAQRAADESMKRISGFYWMGVIRLEE